MENYLIKAIKFVPRKIKRNKRLPYVNKLLFKQCAEIISGVEFVGQELQDMYAYLYFKGKHDGFFIDIGAYDGITISNTYALENIGWKGICVEPIFEIYQNLAKNRKCDCVNAAIHNEETELEFIQTKGGRSGFKGNMSRRMLRAATAEGIVKKLSIKTITFDSLMKKYDTKYIDFMSIDTEGSELAVLSSIDFKEYTFGLITIENNHGSQLKRFMAERGYKLFLDLGADLVFIPKNIEVGSYWWTDPK
jgi:FkbM family methyltransferase